MEKVNFFDLSSQYKEIKKEIISEIQETIESCNFVLGPKVEKFEEDFASRHNCEYGIGVNSGTSALHLSLLAAGIKAGDEVLVPAMTFIATASAVKYIGAIPKFVDINNEDFTINISNLDSLITSNTKAIIPVHLYGQPSNMDEILKFASKYSLKIIEDCAQAHLAKYKNQFVGSFGDMGCFSFYPAKNLGAYGEGGIVITNSKDLADKLRKLRDWGQTKKYIVRY